MRPTVLSRLLDVPSLRALRRPVYAAVWAGALVSNVGTWMVTIAVGIHVTRTTGQSAWTGAIAALTYAPAVALSPLGGALADRMDRRLYLTRITLAQMGLAGVLAALAFSDKLSLSALALLCFAAGCATTLAFPAFNALLAELVPAEDLLSALALSSAQFNLGRILGPVVAAVVLEWGGVTWAFALQAVSFCAVLLALTRVPARGAPGAEHAPPLWQGVREGLSTVWTDGTLRGGVGLILGAALLVAPFIGLLPAFALQELGGGAAGTSLLVSTQGAGAVGAALLVGSVTARVGAPRMLSAAAVALGPAALLFWLAPTLRMAAPAVLVLGALYFILINGLQVLCQGRVPRRLQGRVSSLLSAALSGGYAVGVASLGWLGDHVGLRVSAAGAALLFTGLLLLAWQATAGALRATRPGTS
ncbi:MAG: MFS transporter [Myxococcaceae bacterium]|nr:MFS transporter [Myxococcaceae bacterium]